MVEVIVGKGGKSILGHVAGWLGGWGGRAGLFVQGSSCPLYWVTSSLSHNPF